MMIVRKLNAQGAEVWHYEVEKRSETASTIQVEGYFKIDDRDLGYVTFKRNDRAMEYFYNDRWYNIFAIYDRDTTELKGWYCNICRPATWDDKAVSCEDLELDVWVYPDGHTLIMDEDEFEALNLSPTEQQAAQNAVRQVLTLAADGALPTEQLIESPPPVAKPRIVFMGTPDFAVPTLQALIDTGLVVGVVTQPDRPAGRGKKLRQPPVKEAALAADLPVYQPKSLRKRAAADPLHQWRPDLIVVVAFGQILRPHVLDLPRLGCINIHASLLPRWRGASPIQHAILAGDRQSGITLMQMDVGLDTGDILVAESVILTADETAASLHDRLAGLGGEMITRYLDDILHQRLTPTPQDDSQSTYAPLISKGDGQLDWSQSATELDQRMRAMSPWPGAFTFWDGKQLKIHQARPWHDSSLTAPFGEVVKIDDNIVVVASNGGIQLQRVQLAGKKTIDIENFVRGRPDFVGAILRSNLE